MLAPYEPSLPDPLKKKEYNSPLMATLALRCILLTSCREWYYLHLRFTRLIKSLGPEWDNDFAAPLFLFHSLSLCHMHMSTHTHSNTHKRTYEHTHTHPYTHMSTHTHTHTQTRPQTHTHACTLSLCNADMYIQPFSLFHWSDPMQDFLQLRRRKVFGIKARKQRKEERH